MEAQRLIDLMERVGVRPNVISYTTLIGGHCLAGRTDEAAKLLDGMCNTSGVSLS